MKLFWMLCPLCLFASPLAYFTTKNGEVAVVDSQSNIFLRKYHLFIEELQGDQFLGMVISHDQKIGYVLDGKNKGIWIIDLDADKAITFLWIEECKNPSRVFIQKDGQKLFITDKSLAIIYVIDTASYDQAQILLDTVVESLEVNPINNEQIYATTQEGEVVVIENGREVEAFSLKANISHASDVAYQDIKDISTVKDVSARKEALVLKESVVLKEAQVIKEVPVVKEVQVIKEGQLLPPSSVKGEEVRNRFAMQTERIHILSWEKSLSDGVVGYLISKNGKIIGAATDLDRTMHCHNCEKDDTVYEVRAIDHLYRVSSPTKVEIETRKK